MTSFVLRNKLNPYGNFEGDMQFYLTLTQAVDSIVTYQYGALKTVQPVAIASMTNCTALLVPRQLF
jgi:hypothetical protein